MERAEDPKILALAESEGRVLLSADADFGGILTLEAKRKPSLVLFRQSPNPSCGGSPIDTSQERQSMKHYASSRLLTNAEYAPLSTSSANIFTISIRRGAL